MGLFDRVRRRKAERRHKDLVAAHDSALAEWQTVSDRIDEFVTIVQDCIEGRIHEQFVDRGGYGFMLDNDEFPVAFIPGMALLQVVRGPGQYQGGYGGVSFPLFGRVRGHVGGQRGKLVPGTESRSVTDVGETMITNERVMFRGDLRTEEWKFSRMMAMEHSPDGITVFSMSAKSKPSAIGYGEEVAPLVQFRLELAAALARGTLERLAAELAAERSHHDEERPVPPPAAVTPAAT